MSRRSWGIALASASVVGFLACDDGLEAQCCEGRDGALSAEILEINEPCPLGGLKAAGTEIRSVRGDEKSATEGICGPICCVGADGTRTVTEDLEGCRDAGGVGRLEAECVEGGGGACKCDDAGVTFTIVSGCTGDAFADATEPSFCRSHVEFNLIEDPETFALESGSLLSFPNCEVRITCP